MLPKWTQAWKKGSTELVKHITAVPEAVKSHVPAIQGRISNVDLSGAYQLYDKFTGLDQVRSAHQLVALTEKNFVDRQLERRACQTECFRLEEARNRVNSQLDGVSRSDENFLKLVTELHELSRQHKESRNRLSAVELAEQIAFEEFSGALRRSQAEERVQANRMRQWSIWLSVVAGMVGFGATWLRYHDGRHAASSNATDLVTSLTSVMDEKLAPIIHTLRDSVEDLKRITSQLQPHSPPASDRLSPQPNDAEPSESETATWLPSLKTSLITAGTVTGVAILALLLL